MRLFPRSSDESETDRNGLLSTRREWHALAHGVYDGLTTLRPWAPDHLPDNADVHAEPHYYKAGFVLGTVLQAGTVIGVAGSVVPLILGIAAT